MMMPVMDKKKLIKSFSVLMNYIFFISMALYLGCHTALYYRTVALAPDLESLYRKSGKISEWMSEFEATKEAAGEKPEEFQEWKMAKRDFLNLHALFEFEWDLHHSRCSRMAAYYALFILYLASTFLFIVSVVLDQKINPETYGSPVPTGIA